MNKYLSIGSIVFVIIGVLFLFRPNKQPAPTAIQKAQVATNSGSMEEKSTQTEGQLHTVVFENNTFIPDTITIAAGDTVRFANNDTNRAVWIASAKHPIHTTYPTTGGCLGSTFDSCRGVVTADSWSFMFDEIGEWTYHDHLNPENTGIVIVEPK